MPKRKSKAQIARMMKRAAERGEVYEPPPGIEETDAPDDQAEYKKKLVAARKLDKELKRVANDKDLKAKERRSAKRKAEAIAVEQAGCSLQELEEWYKEIGEAAQEEEEADKKKADRANKRDVTKGQHNPYIVFVGQLSYDTTAQDLFAHVKEELGKEFKITSESVRIRLLSDSRTKKSRGMAFIETNDPELLYACLKLHHTTLDGRRINVERSAGGGSTARKEKLKQYRKEQQDYVSETIDKILQEFYKSGELQEGELDEGVIALCKRHSPATVEATLTRYLESGGRDMDNPSAYFTHMIGKIAAEGRDDAKSCSRGSKSLDGSAPKRRRQPNSSKQQQETKLGTMGKKLKTSSSFSKAGVDMSISEGTSSGQGLSRIFPSMTRGRGRGGRGGYM